MSTTLKVGVAAILVCGIVAVLHFSQRETGPFQAVDPLHAVAQIQEELLDVQAQLEAIRRVPRRSEEPPAPVREMQIDVAAILERLDSLEAFANATSQLLSELASGPNDALGGAASANPTQAIRSAILELERDETTFKESLFSWTPFQVFKRWGRPTGRSSGGDNEEYLIWHFNDAALQKTLTITFHHGVFGWAEITRE